MLRAIRAYFYRKNYDEIYYFDISNVAKEFLNLLGLGQHIKPFNFKLSELKSVTGESLFVRIFAQDINYIYEEIREKLCKNNPFIAQYGKKFDMEKFEAYFMKYFGRDIENIIIFLNVIDWYKKQQPDNLQAAVEFLIERNSCIKILKLFALTEYNIRLRSYISLRYFYGIIRDIFGNLYLSIASIIKPFMHYSTSYNDSRNTQDTVRNPMVATYYNPGGFTFDITKRCDFFWLLNSNIPYQQCLIYFERKDVPATDEMVNVLNSQGVKHIALSKGATATKAMPVYKPSIELTKMMVRLMLRTFFFLIKDFFVFNFKSLKCLPGILYFNRKYSNAYDFYHTMGIKVDVDSGDFTPHHIPIFLALKALGGVSVSFQRSNHPIPQIPYSTFADVHFLFGAHYLPLIKKMGSKNHTVVISGYVTDYSIKTVKEKSKLLRNRIMSNGAEFVICYFDENSSDNRNSPIPNKRSADIYRRLFDLVIADNRIGLICSPKRPRTIPQRLSSLDNILEKAKATGRCLIMGGDYMTGNYPTEAAQASDIVITLLIGGTTYLESVLSGLRTVILDLEGLYSYEEYKWGKETVIFDNHNNLMEAIEKYRNDPASFSEFGDSRIIKTIKNKDPFKDGMAAHRVGTYIQWLIESFDNKKTREEALECARQNYMKEWGTENIY